MNGRAKKGAILAMIVLAVGNVAPLQAAPLPPLFRVNAPYFADHVRYEETAIFWFGHVSPAETYADVRVGYDNSKLYVNLVVFDRRLWYDESPSPGDLTNWDSVSLYLDKDGNVGSAPDASVYCFDGQLDWWEPRADWQAAYQGSGTGWTMVSVPFTTTTDFGWESATEGGFNNNQNNRGWSISYYIPFTSLGVSGPPPQGTIWGLGVVVHDRDADVPASISNTAWPEGMVYSQSATWGQLQFGVPTYTPQQAALPTTVTIRQGLNGVTVPDGMVGGGTDCGGGEDWWTQWGNKNYAGAMQINIQSLGRVSDWPCMSKYYITFPLNTVPTGKVIISATLTLHQFGNAGVGWTPAPQPSWINVLTVEQDWDENALMWNNAPMALENVSGGWVPVLPDYAGDPGIPRTWDVSRAVAEAYQAGEPLRLAMYPSDWELNGGKYFWSSDHDEYPAEARPTLTVTWGEPAATVHKTAWPVAPASGALVTYTISLLGNGPALTLTDEVPLPLSFPGSVSVIGGGVISRDPPARRITWMGTPSVGAPVTLTYVVSAQVTEATVITNTAALADAEGRLTTDTASCIVGAEQVWLPLILRQ
jgi:hypothetical protein